MTNFRYKVIYAGIAALMYLVGHPVVAQQAFVPAVVKLPSGSYLRGDLTGVGDQDERPVMRITVGGFSMTKTEITRAQYDAFLKASGSAGGQGSTALKPAERNKPVTQISWENARAYARWLSAQTGDRWRLPTESEWEYAARGGTVLAFQGSGLASDICTAGNIADQDARKNNPGWRITPCQDGHASLANGATYRPNAFGLYDMHGNVWEWTSSCYIPYDEKQGLFSACKERVMRGGSYQTPAPLARLSNRESRAATAIFQDVGFRLVKE